MTPAFRSALERTISFEGGWSNDPADRGGKTKFGITERTWIEYNRATRCDLIVPEKDVSQITRDEASKIYYMMYWRDMGLDELDQAMVPQNVLNAVFDAGVHHGPAMGVKFLQMAYNGVRYDDGEFLREDGVLGSKTRGAISKFLFRAANERALLSAYAMERGRYMFEIITKDRTQRKFIRGWYGRLLP